ncbi:glycoside hydrolase family 43 protein [Annulohypoxylon bovei var. microspora]|nr:glycoside hydrolase family 43 protein [Annulohypoxylon bovei var. microspora]
MKWTFVLCSLLQFNLASSRAAPSSNVIDPLLQNRADSFQNPVVYEDFADNDVSVGPDGLYYFSASNMHYSPGAPILRSGDLVNWELIGHSVPTLDFGEKYNLTNGHAYRGGTWASTMRFRESTGLWYWIGCVDFWYTYVYTAKDATGPWTKAAVLPGGTCYYDCGLLIDDDDTMYVVYGATDVSVAQLSEDGLSQVQTKHLFSASDVGKDGIEGNRIYKKDGFYYILDDHPGDITYIWKSDSPWGPYECKILVNNVKSPLANGGAPHQGSLIQASTGDWYYMSFTWAYPNGRIPVLAPVKWEDDGFPSFVADEAGGWGSSYPAPLPLKTVQDWTRTDTFDDATLGPDWEWNHNPDETKYKVGDGSVVLSTATKTDDLYAARNTLTHRVHGEFPVGTLQVDFNNMADGDRFGLAAFRDRTAYIGVHRNGAEYTLSVVHNLTQEESAWNTTSNGTIVATETKIPASKTLWLRASLDARASGSYAANFSYSTGGQEFTQLGKPYTMYTNWSYFMGYRFGIFNYATKELGGSVRALSFTSA